MLSIEEKIYGLSLLWREAEYNFAFWDRVPDLDWNEEYLKTLKKVVNTSGLYDYYMELMRFMALLRDGHTYVIMPPEITPKYDIPISTSYIEDAHILTELPKNCNIMPYSKIIKINDILLEDYLNEKVFPYMWHEKLDSAFKYGHLGYAISCNEKGTIHITTANGDFSFLKGKDFESDELIGDNKLLISEPLKRIYSSNNLRIDVSVDNVAYIILYSFENMATSEEFYENLRSIRNCKGYIIDLRFNSGGSGKVAETISCLFFDHIYGGLSSKTPLHNAEYKAFGQYRNIELLDKNNTWERKIYNACTHRLFEQENEAKKPHGEIFLNQPVLILSDCGTASAAESFLADFKVSKRAVIVGANSYGSNGQPFMGVLPGGGKYGICTQYTYLTNGTEYINTGIKPDIYAELTLDDYRNSYNRPFDVAMKCIRKMLSDEYFSGRGYFSESDIGTILID